MFILSTIGLFFLAFLGFVLAATLVLCYFFLGDYVADVLKWPKDSDAKRVAYLIIWTSIPLIIAAMVDILRP